MKNFSLSTYAKEIANILDVELDVSRFYAELVPIAIKPEEFWSRYFFRVILINRNGVVNLDDDDEEEEMQWESAEPSSSNTTVKTAITIEDLQDDNTKLRNQIKSLVSRIGFLENSLLEKDALIKSLRTSDSQSNVSNNTVNVENTDVNIVPYIDNRVGDADVSDTANIDTSIENSNTSLILESDTVPDIDEPKQASNSSDEDGMVLVLNRDDQFSSSSSFVDVEASLTPPVEAISMTSVVASREDIKKALVALDDDEDDEDGGWS